MSRVPKIAETPLELFTPNPDIEEPYLNKIWGPAICSSLALIAQAGTNWTMKRPVYSGLRRYVFWGAVGAVVGKYLDDRRNDYNAEMDAVVRHYISLHPDDFPPFKRQKYADVFETWYPMR